MHNNVISPRFYSYVRKISIKQVSFFFVFFNKPNQPTEIDITRIKPKTLSEAYSKVTNQHQQTNPNGLLLYKQMLFLSCLNIVEVIINYFHLVVPTTYCISKSNMIVPDNLFIHFTLQYFTSCLFSNKN